MNRDSADAEAISGSENPRWNRDGGVASAGAKDRNFFDRHALDSKVGRGQEQLT
jgi:hypothetical protein